MKLTAKEVFDKLINDEKILTQEGTIKFFLGSVDIIVRQRDVVGNIMQEWLEGWFKKNDIEYAVNENTQMPPDFFLDKDNNTKALLEIKAFNSEASPAFDIADFRMYAEEIKDKPYMLDVDYLIFSYHMSDTGIVTIKDVWLKKVWEITRRMEKFPLNLQVKNNVIHKIRPGVWYSDRVKEYSIFECMEDFVSALEETTFKDPRTKGMAPTWLSDFSKNYRDWYGKKIIIPRWYEIEDKYDNTQRNKLAKLEKEKAALEKKCAKQQEALDALQAKLHAASSDAQKKKITYQIEKKSEQLNTLKDQIASYTTIADKQ